MKVKIIQEHSKDSRIKETMIDNIDRYEITNDYLSLYEKYEEIPKNGYDLINRSDSSEGEWKTNSIWVMNDDGKTIENVKCFNIKEKTDFTTIHADNIQLN